MAVRTAGRLPMFALHQDRMPRTLAWLGTSLSSSPGCSASHCLTCCGLIFLILFASMAGYVVVDEGLVLWFVDCVVLCVVCLAIGDLALIAFNTQVHKCKCVFLCSG